jgi:hypothetical protein
MIPTLDFFTGLHKLFTMRYSEPKIWNGFVSRKLIMHLMKKYILEESKKQSRNKPQRVGKMWNDR